LTEAGYNFAHAQNMVNEKLGCSFRYLDTYEETAAETSTTIEALADDIENLSNEQLKEAGFTDEQIEAFEELRKVSKKTGISIKDLIDLIGETDDSGNSTNAFNTRYLVLNSFKNIGLTLVSVLKSVGTAFKEVFSIDPEWLFDLIAGFHKLTQLIKDRVEGNADKLTRTLKGLFSILHLITSLVRWWIKNRIKYCKYRFRSI
jgi:hypothetical protein